MTATPAERHHTAPAVEARSLPTGDPLGEEWGPFGANPIFIGDYQLVTPLLITEHAIPCGYDFITQYSDLLDVMLTGHTPTFVTASYVTEAQQTAEYQDVLQQESDLTSGHGELRYTGLIAVSATTPDELEAAVCAIEQAAIRASCETRRLVGQQAQAFVAAALPVCRGI